MNPDVYKYSFLVFSEESPPPPQSFGRNQMQREENRKHQTGGMDVWDEGECI